MYILNQNGEIPYLGTIQMSSKHPDLELDWSQADRDLVNQYKTDFKPITGQALRLLRQRGKESAKFIITKYLKHLLGS